MASGNPVVTVMEWKEEVELELGSSLSNRANSVKSMCSDGQVSQLETISKVYQNQSSNMKGQVQMPYLEALEKKTKPKSNEIAAFTKLQTLKQGHWDTLTHVRGTRLQSSTVSGDYTRLQPECRERTILHTILHVQRGIATGKVQQPQDCTRLQTGCQ